MIGIAVKGAEKVAKKLDQAQKDTRTAQERMVSRASILVSDALRAEMSERQQEDPFWGATGAAGDGLAARTGKTRASVTGGGRVLRHGNTVIATVGSPQRHLKDHEDGGTFSGKSPKGFHRIPTREAQTAGGQDRYAGRSIRDIEGAFLIRSKTGRLWAALARARFVTLLYLLVRTIKLRPRRIFHRVNERTKPKAVAVGRAEMTSVVNKANA